MDDTGSEVSETVTGMGGLPRVNAVGSILRPFQQNLVRNLAFLSNSVSLLLGFIVKSLPLLFEFIVGLLVLLHGLITLVGASRKVELWPEKLKRPSMKLPWLEGSALDQSKDESGRLSGVSRLLDQAVSQAEIGLFAPESAPDVTFPELQAQYLSKDESSLHWLSGLTVMPGLCDAELVGWKTVAFVQSSGLSQKRLTKSEKQRKYRLRQRLRKRFGLDVEKPKRFRRRRLSYWLVRRCRDRRGNRPPRADGSRFTSRTEREHVLWLHREVQSVRPGRRIPAHVCRAAQNFKGWRLLALRVLFEEAVLAFILEMLHCDPGEDARPPNDNDKETHDSESDSGEDASAAKSASADIYDADQSPRCSWPSVFDPKVQLTVALVLGIVMSTTSLCDVLRSVTTIALFVSACLPGSKSGETLETGSETASEMTSETGSVLSVIDSEADLETSEPGSEIALEADQETSEPGSEIALEADQEASEPGSEIALEADQEAFEPDLEPDFGSAERIGSDSERTFGRGSDPGVGIASETGSETAPDSGSEQLLALTCQLHHHGRIIRLGCPVRRNPEELIDSLGNSQVANHTGAQDDLQSWMRELIGSDDCPMPTFDEPSEPVSPTFDETESEYNSLPCSSGCHETPDTLQSTMSEFDGSVDHPSSPSSVTNDGNLDGETDMGDSVAEKKVAIQDNDIVNEVTTRTGGLSAVHWALVLTCALWNPISFGMALILLLQCPRLFPPHEGPGRRLGNWCQSLMIIPLLIVGAESGGGSAGVPISEAISAVGNVITAVAALSAAGAIQNNVRRPRVSGKSPARVSTSPRGLCSDSGEELQRGAAVPSQEDILGAVDEIYDGVEDLDEVTVRDVMKRIAKRFGWEKCQEPIRSLVKQRLSYLVNREVPMPSRAWTEWRDQLETVEIEGTLYRVVEIEGDGNCFLRALSIALYYDEGARHHDLRRMMVEEMRHPRFRQIYSNGGYLDYETRCDDMGNWGEYIEHPEILALSTLLQIHFVIYDERNKDNLVHIEPADGSPTPGPPITFRLTNANSERACHYELLVEDSEQDWSKFYSSFYPSAFCEVADSIYEDEKLGESASSYDSKSDDSCSIADDDNDDDYVEESVHRDCGRKGRTKKAAASKRKAATSHSDSSHGKRARTKKNPPDHKPSTKKMCTDPEPEEFLDPCDRESDFWFLGDCQCPEKILEELRSLEQNGPAKKIEDGKKRLQKLLLEHSKFLDREDLSEEQIEESFNKFKKDLAELISELCPEYSNRLNFGQALSELTELLVVLHYAPDSDKDFKKGTCTFDKMPPGSNCLAWLLKVVPKALNEEAGGTGMSAESLKRVAECVTMVDLRPIIPVSKKKCLSEFNTVRNGLGLTHGKFDLIGHLLVAYHAKFFQALKKNKERQLPVLAGSYLVNARMYNESGRVTSSAVRKEGCIAHPECWLAGYIGNSIIYSIDDYEEFGRALSRAFGHVAKVVDGFQVPQESRIGLRYGGLEDMTEAELKELREVLREMRARIGRKRTRAAEMYAICMHDGQSHDGAMDTIREELGDSYANLLQGSFDGGATTGKMITKAFKTYNECVDNKMTHEDAIKEVENRHGPKHANLVRGCFEAGH
ncbi:hypothetical protein THAOC_19745, partial [Thalassiosira oceanica]